MMRDWFRLRQASFRGARFYVDEDGPDVGRRVAVHDISGGERPVTEDMGREATVFTVSAYVTGDEADALGHALQAACERPGPGLLTLPIDPAKRVHCRGCSRSREKDRNGYIAYRLDFVEAGSGSGGIGTALGALRDVFTAGVGALAKAMA